MECDLSSTDAQIDTALTAARTGANDHYLMTDINNKIMTAVVQEG